MKTAIVTSSALELTGRMDAAFHCLHQKHAPAAAELMEKFTREELVSLAKLLPYNHEAAQAVCVRMTGGTFGKDRGQSYFNEWIDGVNNSKSPIPRKHAEVAVYCAAAAHHACAKALNEILELRKQELAKLNAFNSVLEVAKRSPALLALMKDK